MFRAPSCLYPSCRQLWTQHSSRLGKLLASPKPLAGREAGPPSRPPTPDFCSALVLELLQVTEKLGREKSAWEMKRFFLPNSACYGGEWGKGIAASPPTSAEQEEDERYILPHGQGHVQAKRLKETVLTGWSRWILLHPSPSECQHDNFYNLPGERLFQLPPVQHRKHPRNLPSG